jgi:hypothetical protein
VVLPDHERIERGSGHTVARRRVSLAFSGDHQVVAPAEAAARTGQQKHVDRGVEVGALDQRLQPLEQRSGDAIPPLGPVEGEASDPARDVVEDVAHAGSARSMIAPASTPAGSVP